MRVSLRFLRVDRILFEFSLNFHLIETGEVWKLLKVRKLNLLTPFQDTKAFFHLTSSFFFHRTSWDQLFHRGSWKLIFNRISWNTSQNQMGLVSSWSIIKILSYKVKLFFSFLVEFLSPVHEFGCSTHFVKFVILSTSSNQNHMRIGNQVQNLSKCTIKIPKSFHHL